LSEQHTEQTLKVRQITDVHANWSSQGPLEDGKFSYQLILDNGAEEALIMPTADDANVLRDLTTTRTRSTGTPRMRSSSSAR
jgi:hypothetical protein